MCQHITAVRGGGALALVCRVGYDHPAHHQVEQEHGVDGQGFSSGRITVPEEHHGGKSAPDKAGQHNDTPAWL